MSGTPVRENVSIWRCRILSRRGLGREALFRKLM